MAASGSMQLVNVKVRSFDKATGEAVGGSCELVPGGTQPAALKVARWGDIKESLKQEMRWQVCII